MKILQTIIGLDAKLGGPSSCTYELMHAMREIGCDVEILTTEVTDPTDHMVGNGEEWIKVVDKDFLTPFAISKNLKEWLELSEYDVYHANTLWMYQSHITCKIARDKCKPYIISPHGMLYPNGLRRSWWKKRLMLTLFFNKDINKAAVLHATCIEEMRYIRSFGYKGPIAVIPNPVASPDNIEQIIEDVPKQKRIGYLGRLHPYKRPDALIEAWGKLGTDTTGWELVLMGRGEKQYEKHLHELVKIKNLKNVCFLGTVSGIRKYQELASMRATCCPSLSENFGMTVAESLICGTPVICTDTAPWEDLNTYNCGWWCKNNVETLSNKICEAMNLSEKEVQTMGCNGRRLVNENYKDIKVATQMYRLYNWIVNKGEKPSFVYCI